MYCRNCGEELPDLALMCPKCGTPVKPYQDSASVRAEEPEQKVPAAEALENQLAEEPEKTVPAAEVPENQPAEEPEKIVPATEVPENQPAEEPEQKMPAAEAEQPEQKMPAAEAEQPEWKMPVQPSDPSGSSGSSESSESDGSEENVYSRQIRQIREEYSSSREPGSQEPGSREPVRRLPVREEPVPAGRSAYDNPVNRGRIPYTASSVDPEDAEAVQSRFSSLSFIVSLISIVLILFPYGAVPVSVMAVLFGIIGLRRKEVQRKRAIVGIVIGTAVFLFASVMSFCLILLMPYAEDLTAAFQTYFQSMR